ncbi:MAG: prenyltransferase [Gammaproteobacteria bacterium]
MSADKSAVMEPRAADFGDSRVKRLFHATRPKFFPASVLPVIVGTAWGAAQVGTVDIAVAVLALVATMLVHGAGNVLNDVGDETGGSDRRNEKRIYPYTGGSRFIQNQVMTTAEMARWGIQLLAAAVVVGLVLIWLRGIGVLWFGLAGVALGIVYSLGPLRLSSLGLGEIAIGIAFGILPVSGAAWLQSGTLDLPLLVFALPVSAWVAAIVLINEVPDMAADSDVGKATWPVRFGRTATAAIYVGLHLLAASSMLWLTLHGYLPLLAPAVPFVLLVLSFRAAGAVRRSAQDPDGVLGAIEFTLASHTIGCLWAAACVLYTLWQ